MEPSTKGWNWGEFDVQEDRLLMNVDERPGFNIDYKEIANCGMPGRNELALEFQQDESVGHDIICEMRLLINDPDCCSSLAQEILERADLKAHPGEALVTLYEMPMLVPRGKYSIDMFYDFMRLHGKTHNYKIMYRNINRAFLLPSPDGVHVSLVLGLEAPIRQGNMMYPFIVIQFNKEAEQSVSLNMPIEEIEKRYGDQLSDNMEGKSFDIVSRLLKAMAKVSIVIPGDQYRSNSDTHAVKCSVRASEGYLYPLQKSLIFIFKPVLYIKFEDIVYIEFSRVSEHKGTIRSFDLAIKTKKGMHQLTGVDRKELQNLKSYLEKKNINIRNVEEEDDDNPKEMQRLSNQIDFGDDDDDEDDESFKEDDDSDN